VTVTSEQQQSHIVAICEATANLEKSPQESSDEITVSQKRAESSKARFPTALPLDSFFGLNPVIEGLGTKKFDKLDNPDTFKEDRNQEFRLHDLETPSVEATLKACEADALAAHQEVTASTETPLTVPMLLVRMRHTTSLIEQLLEAHPELANVNFRKLDKNSTSPLGIAIRQSVWSVFARTGWMIGRGSSDATKEDMKSWLAANATLVNFESGRGPKSKTDPFAHIANVILPVLDRDMAAHAHDMNTYRTKATMKFYNLLALWRFRGKDDGSVTVRTH
jgi:hypothetical protein